MLLNMKGPRLCFSTVLQKDFMFTEWLSIAVTYELGQ